MRTGIFLLLSIVSMTASCFAQTFDLSDDQSKITFVIDNFGLAVDGSVKGLVGKFVLDKANGNPLSFEATVASSTINTAIDLRDKHLRQSKYFDCDAYPQIKIVSKDIRRASNGWIAEALVTIKGITKNISIPFTIALDNGLAILKGNFELNRRDFSVGGNSLTLSDNVNIQLKVVGSLTN